MRRRRRSSPPTMLRRLGPQTAAPFASGAGLGAALLCFLLGLALIAPAGASASDIVYGTTSTSLVRFNASTPQTIDATLPLQGLSAGVTVAGIDERPESASLNALGSDGRLYRVGKTTGVAEALGTDGLTTTLTGAG